MGHEPVIAQGGYTDFLSNRVLRTICNEQDQFERTIVITVRTDTGIMGIPEDLKPNDNADDEPPAEFLLGIGYQNQRKYKKAAESFLIAAEKGHAGSQYHLGRLYYDGVGMDIDEEEAYKWFLKAAEQGDRDSQFMLGHMYEQGLTTGMSYEKAFEWFKRSADNGHVGAMMNIGYMYAAGMGTEQSYEKAFECYMSAAEKQDPYAQYSVGNLYLTGMGVDRSDEKAVEWYEMAVYNRLSEVEQLLKDLKDGYTLDDLPYLTDNETGVILAVMTEFGEYYYGFCGEDLFFRDDEEEEDDEMD